MTLKNRIPEKIFVFVFGGFIGAVMNWVITYSLTEYLDQYYVVSNLIGSIVNVLFNFAFHRSVTFKVLGDVRRRFIKFLILSGIVVIINISIVFILTEFLGLWYLISVIAATFIVVVFNFAVNQLSVFYDVDKTNVSYEEIDYDFYKRQTNSINPLRSWFHTRRQELLDETVRKYYSEGKYIVDLGSGSCEWNAGHLPVTGVDLNKNMLEYAISKGNLKDYRVSNINSTGIDGNTVDIVVMSEVMEHIRDYDDLIREVYRILKPGGILIVTVPYDTAISFWKPLFFVQCLIQGYVLGHKYYQNRCGHVHSFSPWDIKRIFSSKGFNITDQFDMRRFTIFTVARKEVKNE